MPMINLTISRLDRIKTPDKDTRYYDKGLKGFGVKMHKTGRRAYFVEYRHRGKRRRMTIGTYPPMGPDQAREHALKLLAGAAEGRDPLNARKRRNSVPTFEAWVLEYMEGVRVRKKRPELDELYLGRAAAQWPGRLLDEITPRDVEALMHRVVEETQQKLSKRVEQAKRNGDDSTVQRLEARRSPGITTANRQLASVRACFQAAWRVGLIKENPAARVGKFRENEPRSRVLSEVEMNRLVDAINSEIDVHTKAAFHLLIGTGARLSEVLRATWADLDLDAATWRIPSPKAGKPQVMPLASTTVQMLRDLPRVGRYVIAGRKTDRPRYDLKSAWERLCNEAKLEGVTVHDIRRTFGLHVARSSGLHIASKLLRHSDVRITEKVYCPLGLEELSAAIEKAQRPGWAAAPE